MDQLAPEERAGGHLAGFGPVDTGDARAAVASVGIFFAVYDDAGVEEGGADEPEGGGDATGLLLSRVSMR